MAETPEIPNWVDQTEYPFKHQYIDPEAGYMHYVDEGEGDIILFVHGTPTWSFLYRHFITAFSKGHRVIAIDHIGFGLSEKPKTFAGQPQNHAQNLVEFIRKMDLHEITLVVHDFGGPIGLAAAIEQTERIKQLVLFNTWLWETASNKEAQKVGQVINSFLGRFIYLRLNFSPRLLLKKAFTEKKYLSGHIHQQYIKPFPNKQSRLALYRIAQSLAGSSDWYQQQWQQISALENKRWLILWGTKDPFFNIDFLKKWWWRLPQAEVHTFDCGHFVQEERTGEAISAMCDFLYPEVKLACE
ncbi:alpha/beta fold hydrolase [Aliifodinibius sp. S!AR15-10]|uniref:alpha/beta fold hydrolase n=1 Tax=Aliifodinibius sp. S!AR15-10 TaxID=2950437 RepID=UPI00285AA39E|nr:alpha/beta fold hydrolase [Aliifodinibius sp. S!AR15-10]MDR8392639.1 alpha/beta fold hydrolase [Aliifodinibius sp. S!AR15-10]